MAQITITTVEELTVFIYTEFSFDDKEVSYDPTQQSAWNLNNQDRVEKDQSTRDKPITEEEADVIYRHGWSDGAHTRRVQVKQVGFEYDSLKAAGIEEDEVEDDYRMDSDQLDEAKSAMEAVKAQCEIGIECSKGTATGDPTRI